MTELPEGKRELDSVGSSYGSAAAGVCLARPFPHPGSRSSRAVRTNGENRWAVRVGAPPATSGAVEGISASLFRDRFDVYAQRELHRFAGPGTFVLLLPPMNS